MKTLPDKQFVYHHKNPHRVLVDIPNLEYRSLIAGFNIDIPYYVDGDTLYLSTWFATSPVWNGGNGYGCSLNTLYELFKQHMRTHFAHTIKEPVESFIPTIDYSYYHTSGVSNFLRTLDGKKKVLVANGLPLSGQTRILAGVLDAVVEKVARVHPETLFFVTSPVAFSLPNVVYTRDVIGLPADVCDLPENSFLSTHCDVVVGLGSGAYSYSYVAENLLDSKKVFVCFTDDEKTARWIYPTNTVKVKISWSNNYEQDNMISMIEGALWTH
jgi:hypothetical protein